MGQEVAAVHFERRDFERFDHHLRDETALLHDWIERGELSRSPPVAGLELEAWLVDRDGRPAPRNAEFLERLGSPDVVTELGRFNIEFNVPPQPLAGDGLGRLGAELQARWDACGRVAAQMGLAVVAIGILPTLRDDDLVLANISARSRYRALNEQVMRQRAGRPIRLDIEGGDGQHLISEHRDVMLEAGATSFQAHLQTTPELAARAYNASLIVSAPLVAVGANSPFLFGQALWHETRIALFEQALDIGTWPAAYHGHANRVGFGSGYAAFSLAECFAENRDAFPPLLPLEQPEARERLPHLRLHNGTIWRWNRPLVGFDADGTPHLRIEHRPMAAGPTIADMVAQLALYYGLVAWLARCDEPPELRLPFEAARANFYAAARQGLGAELTWLDGDRIGVRALVGESLLDHAHDGLAMLGVDPGRAGRLLAIIEQRIDSGQNGAAWQRRHVARHGGDFARLVREYAARQAEGRPVGRWTD